MTCEATKRPRSVWVSLHFGRFPIKPPVTPVGQGKGRFFSCMANGYDVVLHNMVT